MTQPNEQLIETIEKALEAAKPGPWLSGSGQRRPYEITCGPYGDEGGWVFADVADEGSAHLIANAPEWLRSLLEENKRLNEAHEGFMIDWTAAELEHGQRAEELQQSKEELEQEKKVTELFDQRGETIERLLTELEQVKADNMNAEMNLSIITNELSAKDKVLNRIANSTPNNSRKWMKELARTILSQYTNRTDTK